MEESKPTTYSKTHKKYHESLRQKGIHRVALNLSQQQADRLDDIRLQSNAISRKQVLVTLIDKEFRAINGL